MLVHFLHLVASGTAVFAGVELTGILCEGLADGCGEGQTRVGVDVDFADGALSGFAELLFGDTYCIGELATILVDDVDILLGNA